MASRNGGPYHPTTSTGRDSTETAFWALKQFNPDVQIVSQAWPKMFAPDYTTNITALLKDKPDAIYSALWGGDLVAFIEQAKMYGLFQQSKFFAINLGDFTVLEAVKGLPEGLYLRFPVPYGRTRHRGQQEVF